jgi:SagB-type dehydrogenase family enzyme
MTEISQLLWAAQGITKERKAPSRWNQDYEWQGGHRTAPSAGALFPLELYLVAANVDGLSQGVYKFVPRDHSIIKVADGDKRDAIFEVGLKQASIKHAPAQIVIAAVYERTSVKYGDRSEWYIFIETGHVGQNIYLQSAALGMGTVMTGAFDDEGLKDVLRMPEDEEPMAIMPIGRERKE